MNPKYSVLLCGQSVHEYSDKIGAWLSQGIKIIWLGSDESCKGLKEKYEIFAKAYLLQCFVNNGGLRDIIVDGDDQRGTIKCLESSCPLFNSAQYMVEHCKADLITDIDTEGGD